MAQDVLSVVREFFIRVAIPKAIANTLIVLIPKKETSSLFADYRPISLCSFMNKMFTKVLSNHLKALLPSLILKEQSAFVQGREISDNILLAQELVGSPEKKIRGHNIIFKLDMMKAFDRVSWIFLSKLLAKLDIHSHFIAFIMSNLAASCSHY